MSEFHKKIALLQQMLDTANRNLSAAQAVIRDIVGDSGGQKAFASQGGYLNQQLDSLSGGQTGDVIEGIFDGEKMITEADEEYPVPANYASKSKLVVGDALKLTVAPNGNFIYKQIGPVERQQVIGTLVKEEGKYSVMVNGRLYRLLTAAVTYHRAEIGDKIAVSLPIDADVDWAAFEHVVPEGAGESEEEMMGSTDEVF